MTGETPEVCSDKRKLRENRQSQTVIRVLIERIRNAQNLKMWLLLWTYPPGNALFIRPSMKKMNRKKN